MRRRTFLLATLGGGVALSGCLQQRQPSSPTSTPTPTETGSLVVLGDGEYPHKISVENSLDRSLTMTLNVERAGTTVYEDTVTVEAQTAEVIASITEESLPRESRAVTVTGTTSAGQTAQSVVSIYECLGEVVFFTEADGTLHLTYSVC